MPFSIGGTISISFGNACVTTICYVAQTIISIINNILVPVLFAVAFIVFLWGIARAYIFSTGDQEAVQQGHRLILWGLLGFVVMISVWGLVNIIANTFGLYGTPPLPQPGSPYPVSN